MSFLKKLFGGGGQSEGPAAAVKTLDYKGFIIEARPYKEGGQYQTAGLVWKDVDGARKEHSFIRADRFAAEEDAADHAIFKGQQMIDQMGESIFR
jgi:hypothetical protein